MRYVPLFFLVPCATCLAAEVPGFVQCVMSSDVKLLKDTGANSCLLWGVPREEKWDEISRAGVFVFLNGLERPPREFFEYEGKKRVRMKIPYCYSGEWGKWWVGHVERGAVKDYPAAVNVVPDEFAWTNGHVPYSFNVRLPVGTPFYCGCPDCKGGAGGLPEITASRFLRDSPEARRYVQYRYETVARVLRESHERARRANPSFLSYYTLNLREVQALERYPYGVALDMLPPADMMIATSFQTTVDRRGKDTRFDHAETVKRLLAARPRLGAMCVLAATVYDYKKAHSWTEAYHWREEVEKLLPAKLVSAMRKELELYKLREDEIILPALSCVAHGSKGVMFFGGEGKAALKKLFSFLAKIEKDLARTKVPGKIVLLCSRTSEDAWMLSHAPKVGPRADYSDAMMQVGCWAQPSNRIAWAFNKSARHALGFRSTKAAFQALVKLGVPFRMHFVENLRSADLADSEVAVVPFCTQISEKKARILREFAAKKRLIVFAHRGERSEKARAEKVFEGRTVTFFKGEACDVLADERGRKRLLKAIRWPFELKVRGGSEDVERAWLGLPRGCKMLFLINWGAAPEKLKIDFARRGKVTLLDLSGAEKEGASRLSVELPARDARVLVFRPGGSQP